MERVKNINGKNFENKNKSHHSNLKTGWRWEKIRKESKLNPQSIFLLTPPQPQQQQQQKEEKEVEEEEGKLGGLKKKSDQESLSVVGVEVRI